MCMRRGRRGAVPVPPTGAGRGSACVPLPRPAARVRAVAAPVGRRERSVESLPARGMPTNCAACAYGDTRAVLLIAANACAAAAAAVAAVAEPGAVPRSAGGAAPAARSERSRCRGLMPVTCVPEGGGGGGEDDAGVWRGSAHEGVPGVGPRRDGGGAAAATAADAAAGRRGASVGKALTDSASPPSVGGTAAVAAGAAEGDGERGTATSGASAIGARREEREEHFSAAFNAQAWCGCEPAWCWWPWRRALEARNTHKHSCVHTCSQKQNGEQLTAKIDGGAKNTRPSHRSRTRAGRDALCPSLSVEPLPSSSLAMLSIK